MDNYHVTKSADGWLLRKEGSVKALKTALTKVEILMHASEVFDGRAASLTIHRADRTEQRYRLTDLMAQCDFEAPEPKDLTEWHATQPVGREI